MRRRSRRGRYAPSAITRITPAVMAITPPNRGHRTRDRCPFRRRKRTLLVEQKRRSSSYRASPRRETAALLRGRDRSASVKGFLPSILGPPRTCGVLMRSCTGRMTRRPRSGEHAPRAVVRLSSVRSSSCAARFSPSAVRCGSSTARSSFATSLHSSSQRRYSRSKAHGTDGDVPFRGGSVRFSLIHARGSGTSVRLRSPPCRWHRRARVSRARGRRIPEDAPRTHGERAGVHGRIAETRR
jgi:hypothetical protein